MAKGAFRLKADLERARKQVAFIKSWGTRLKKVQPMLGYLAADYIKKHVQAKIRASTMKTYRGALEVVRVKGTRPGEYAYAVQIDEHNKDVRHVQPNKQLIFVAAKKKMARTPPEVLILQKYSPWTADTLPFKPDAKDATVTTKNVKAMDVVRTTQLKRRQRHLWARELAKCGVQSPRSKQVNFSRQTAELPNVALDAFKIEFGLGAQKPNPAWRKALLDVSKKGFGSFLKDRKNFIYPLTRPSFSVWKKWPPRTSHSISISQAKKFQGFQRKIAPKSG